MNSKNVWDEFKLRYNLDREKSVRIWDSLVGYIRTDGYKKGDSDKQEIDRFVCGVLEENGIALIDDRQIRKLTNFFLENDDLNAFHESLMGILTYLLCIFDMTYVLFNEFFDSRIEAFTSDLFRSLESDSFAETEIFNVLDGLPFFGALLVWLILEHCLRGKKRRRAIFYLNRHTALLSVFLLFIFYNCGLLVFGTYYSLLPVVSVLIPVMTNASAVNGNLFIETVTLILRIVVMIIMAIYPVYLMLHYKSVDRAAVEQAERIRKRNGVYRKVLLRIRLR